MLRFFTVPRLSGNPWIYFEMACSIRWKTEMNIFEYPHTSRRYGLAAKFRSEVLLYAEC
jgi:hypothetical protein